MTISILSIYLQKPSYGTTSKHEPRSFRTTSYSLAKENWKLPFECGSNWLWRQIILCKPISCLVQMCSHSWFLPVRKGCWGMLNDWMGQKSRHESLQCRHKWKNHREMAAQFNLPSSPHVVDRTVLRPEHLLTAILEAVSFPLAAKPKNECSS